MFTKCLKKIIKFKKNYKKDKIHEILNIPTL